MTTFKFLHAADLHLDSPLLGLANKSVEFSERVEEASRRAFDNLVELAIAEGCRFVTFAGDIFDGEPIGHWRVEKRSLEKVTTERKRDLEELHCAHSVGGLHQVGQSITPGFV